MPDNSQPVLLIVFELRQLDGTAVNFANNSLLLTILLALKSFKLACTLRPFLNFSGRVNHFVVLAVLVVDLVQASLEQFKSNFFGRLLVSLEGLLILTLLV